MHPKSCTWSFVPLEPGSLPKVCVEYGVKCKVSNHHARGIRVCYLANESWVSMGQKGLVSESIASISPE